MGKSNQDEAEFVITAKRLDKLIAWVIWLWLVAFFGVPLVSWCVDGLRLDQFALLGDSLGSVNALFSALAVIAVLLSLRVQQKEVEQTLHIAQEEQELERMRQFRSATPVLISSPKQPMLVAGTDLVRLVWELKNEGTTIFTPNLVSCDFPDDFPYQIRFHASEVVPNGRHISVSLDLKSDSEIDSRFRHFDFEIQCVDINGNHRRQIFTCDIVDGGPIECKDPGLPTISSNND